jgi:SAM-dependent methyltransferase
MRRGRRLRYRHRPGGSGIAPHWPSTSLVGIEPAAGMRAIACQRASALPNVSILEGRFEALPLADESVGHLYSIHAFHWVSDVDRAIGELHRVLAPDADLDLFFAGRGTGQEFIGITSGILLRHLGLAGWLASAKLRKQLTLEQARELFGRGMPGRDVHVRELVQTHFRHARRSLGMVRTARGTLRRSRARGTERLLRRDSSGFTGPADRCRYSIHNADPARIDAVLSPSSVLPATIFRDSRIRHSTWPRLPREAPGVTSRVEGVPAVVLSFEDVRASAASSPYRLYPPVACGRTAATLARGCRRADARTSWAERRDRVVSPEPPQAFEVCRRLRVDA